MSDTIRALNGKRAELAKKTISVWTVYIDDILFRIARDKPQTLDALKELIANRPECQAKHDEKILEEFLSVVRDS